MSTRTSVRRVLGAIVWPIRLVLFVIGIGVIYAWDIAEVYWADLKRWWHDHGGWNHWGGEQ